MAELEQFTGFLASTLSGGMKQKLSLICALLHHPQLLVLDEPNNGVDLMARGEMWTILRQLQDVTVVMSTGYLDEADRCDQVAYLYHGRIRVQGTPQGIKSQFPGNAYRLLGDIPASVLASLRHAQWARRVREIGESVTVETALSRKELQDELHAGGGSDLLVEALTPTLEMVFTELTEQAERERDARPAPLDHKASSYE
jgi:ABC-2 type transport system ATP-binding protein